MCNTKKMFVLAVIGVFIGCALCSAREISLEALPASVIKTVPTCGDTRVDPNLKEISVTFSKDMLDQAWSFVRISPESFPTLVGNPSYRGDKRTCVVKVTLEPSKTYAIWLNSEKFHDFRDADKKPAVPYLLVFRTSAK
jgi:hypothetical protein